MPELPDKKYYDRIHHSAENWNKRDLTSVDRAPFAEYIYNNEPACRQRKTKHVPCDTNAARSLSFCYRSTLER